MMSSHPGPVLVTGGWTVYGTGFEMTGNTARTGAVVPA